MSESVDILTAGTHVVSGIGGAGAVGVLMRWLAGKDAVAAREEFILLRADVKQLIADMGEHKKVFEDVVTTKNAVKALFEKVDDMRTANRAIEQRLTALETRRKR